MSLGYWLVRVSDSLHSKAFEWLHMRTVIRTGDIKAVKPPTLIKLITSIIDDMKLPLTSVSVMKGNSMSPTFNDGVKDGEGDKLVVRKIRPRGYGTNVFEGDLVVVRVAAPTPECGYLKYVRRLAALEGTELISEDPNDDSFTVKHGMCWVVCDNPESDEPDSRTFGPLQISRILGRVIYRFQSKTEHGPVTNSTHAKLTDDLVLYGEEEHFKSQI